MLWFRLGAVLSLLFTLFLSIGILLAVFVMCINPANGKAMNSDPYYNGTLFFYILVILSEITMGCASGFGFMVAFKIWRNNHQMDHSLRQLFSMWLGILGFAIVFIFILGILGLVRYREAQEEITSLFEVFAKYSQDVKFVGSFERYQRENSCCGINSPDDWMTAQYKTSSGGGGLGGYGGYDSSYMGSPSTGKCHLTPPTVPMGCGKKLLEEIHFTMAVYSGVIILQTMGAIAAAALGWYCFFYWIEKEVIIIPEDEVSNLIVIEPESSTSTLESESGSSSYYSGSGSTFSGSRSRSMYSRSGSILSRFSQPPSYLSNSRNSRDSRDYLGSRFTYSGYHGSKSYYPNSRGISGSGGTKFSNFNGAIPSIGGPHADYMKPLPDVLEENHNIIDPSMKFSRHPSAGGAHKPSKVVGALVEPQVYTATVHGQAPPASLHAPAAHGSSRMGPHYHESPILHPGTYGRSVYHSHTRSGSRAWSGKSGVDTASYIDPSGSYVNSGSSIRSGSYINSTTHHHKKKKVKKEHSKNHMLHKQEKALGGKVLAEMHVDHTRDPDPMNSTMDVAKGHRGHRAHHATIAIVKNKTAKKPKNFLKGGLKGHGQTGHVAADILEMSGGAAAVKSLVDDINLPVEHDAHLADGPGYVNKLHREKKKKGQLDHPDPDHPGHGPIKNVNGMVSAPSIDGSQAQSLMDNLLSTEPKPKPKEPAVKAHAIDEDPKAEKEEAEKNHGHHHHKHDHHHRTESHLGSHHHGHDQSNHHHHHHHHNHTQAHLGSSHHHDHSHNHHHHSHHRHDPSYNTQAHLGSHHHGHHHHHPRHYPNSRASLETEVIYKTTRNFS